MFRYFKICVKISLGMLEHSGENICKVTCNIFQFNTIENLSSCLDKNDSYNLILVLFIRLLPNKWELDVGLIFFSFEASEPAKKNEQ